MNAREMIARLQELDPETPIRYSYHEDFRDFPTLMDVEDISTTGWINGEGDDLYEAQNEFIRESSEGYGFAESFTPEVLESFLAQARELSEHHWSADEGTPQS